MGKAGVAVWGWMLVVAGLACGDGERSTIEVRARAPLDEATGLAGLTLRIGAAAYGAHDFHADESGLLEVSRDLPGSGVVTVALELHQGGAVVARGEFPLEMRRNFEWGMDLFRQVEDPTEGCFGCMGVRRIDIAAEVQNLPGESIWIAWGGRERGSGIVSSSTSTATEDPPMARRAAPTGGSPPYVMGDPPIASTTSRGWRISPQM